MYNQIQKVKNQNTTTTTTTTTNENVFKTITLNIPNILYYLKYYNNLDSAEIEKTKRIYALLVDIVDNIIDGEAEVYNFKKLINDLKDEFYQLLEEEEEKEEVIDEEEEIEKEVEKEIEVMEMVREELNYPEYSPLINLYFTKHYTNEDWNDILDNNEEPIYTITISYSTFLKIQSKLNKYYKLIEKYID